MNSGPHVMLAILAALAFASGLLIVLMAVRISWRFQRAPEFVLKHFLTKVLGGRAMFVCTACPNVHIVPPLPRNSDGTPAWAAALDDIDTSLALQSLVHEGQPLQVLARRIAAREDLSFFGVVALLMTPEERDNALAAIAGEAQDDLVDTLVHKELQHDLAQAIADRDAMEAAGFEGDEAARLRTSSLRRSGGIDLDDVAAGRDPWGADQVRRYIALLTPEERTRFVAALTQLDREAPVPAGAAQAPARAPATADLSIVERNSKE